MSRISLDLKNKKFGMLTPITRTTSKTKDGHIKWLCQCECGNSTEVTGTNIKRGHTLSCGCLHAEHAARIGRKAALWQTGEKNCNYKHGLSQTKEYARVYSCRRIRRIKNQTPKKFNNLKIALFYKLCKKINTLKIGEYEVDHIRPLSRNGEQHEDNLQILKTDLNRNKGSKWPLTEQEKVKYRGLTIKDIEWALGFNYVNC